MKRINLIPLEAQKISFTTQARQAFRKSRGVQLCAGVLILFASLYVFQNISIWFSNQQIGFLRSEIRNLEEKIVTGRSGFEIIKKQREAVEAERKSMIDRLRALQEEHRKHLPWSKVLTRLSEYIPQEVWVQKVGLKEESITVSGMSLDYTLVSNFMKSLDKSPHFSETTFTYTQKEKILEQPVVKYEIKTHPNLTEMVR